MPKITPHLWYDREAREAAAFYASVFDGSEVTDITTIRDTPSGDCDLVSFTLCGQPFMAISAGPHFRLNPSISFMVRFSSAGGNDASAQIRRAWDGFSEGGQALMPLDAYPFSPCYGWIQDRFGLSWQLIETDDPPGRRPAIVPSMLFVGPVCGRAEEAIDYFGSVFPGSRRGDTARYPAGAGPDREGTLMYADFRLGDTWLAAMDSAHAHAFAFNEAVSFMVNCETQDEIDHYWGKLSAVPEAEQCGWVKDRFGVSWQIVPTALGELMRGDDPDRVDRVTQAMLKMKKLDIAGLKRA